MTIVNLDRCNVIQLADARRVKGWKEFELERMRRILIALEMSLARGWDEDILTEDYSEWESRLRGLRLSE